MMNSQNNPLRSTKNELVIKEAYDTGPMVPAPSNRYALKDDGKSHQSQNMFNPIHDSLDKHMTPMRKDSVLKSYNESQFVSPKSISESVSVPFNFASENDIHGRSSMYSNSSQAMKYGK